MRILVHDYPGHAFPVQLSRALAALGHSVLHVYLASFQTPKGPLARRAHDSLGLEIRGLALDRPFAKYDFVRRVLQERRFGRMLADTIENFVPDVVLSGNAPLDVQKAALGAAREAHAGFVFWMQDIYGVAIERILRKKLPVLGHAIGAWYARLERRLVRKSDHTVVISEDFMPILGRWSVPRERLTVIENWAGLDELAARPRANSWAAAHGLVGKTVLLYAGTLGLKHDPEMLLGLAHAFEGRPEVRIVVVSEGLGADWLAAHAKGHDNLQLLPFQPFERLPDVLAASDVLVAILEPDAGVYSVPSKVLTYLCAGRPVLAAIPPQNLAARILEQNRAGLVAPPGDSAAFAAAAKRLVGDPHLRQELANNALDYAAKTFDINSIAARFMAILARVGRR